MIVSDLGLEASRSWKFHLTMNEECYLNRCGKCLNLKEPFGLLMNTIVGNKNSTFNIGIRDSGTAGVLAHRTVTDSSFNTKR